jgi:hypothetical protein
VGKGARKYRLSMDFASGLLPKWLELRSIAKIKSEEITSANNLTNLLSNATIRKECVRYGKLNCPSKYGLYYYAYWKDDSSMLKKRYIGKYHPPVHNASKTKSRDIDLAPSDTLTDPSNSSEDV